MRASRVKLTLPSARDRDEFLRLARSSRDLHRPWVYPPASPRQYMQYVKKMRTEHYQRFFLRDWESGGLAGVFELGEITRGILQSAYLGFYAMAPHAGRGYMREGLELVLRYTFRDLKLHRVEAAIQPGNARSLALVKRCGFTKEGFSPRYLKIGGRWRDHERWALLIDDWRSRKRA